MVKKFFSLSNATLLVALTLSGIAAWYSIIGLTAIFAAAVVPIIIMGSALELAKITTTVWLRKYWHKASWIFKLYLIPAVFVLALLTSMGIFGFLSKAHIDQGVPSGDVASKVTLLDEKIKTERDNIKANREALSQMDAQVNNVMNKGDSEKSAERSVQIRRQQVAERTRLQKEIENSNNKISTFNEERSPIASQLRKVEAEVGPIKYIAALIYGDNPDQNILERAVRWVIILLVIVFDPLALVLVLAANQSKEWDNLEDDIAAMSIVPPKDEEIRPFTSEEIDALDKTTTTPVVDMEEPNSVSEYSQMDPPVYEPDDSPIPTKQVEHDPGPPFEGIKDNITNTWVQTGPSFEEPKTIETENVTTEAYKKASTGYVEVAGKHMSEQVFHTAYPEFRILVADDSSPVGTSFGTRFPELAIRGDIFTRVDTLPHRSFKFDGTRWIEINRTESDSYLTDPKYVQLLIEKLEKGEYDPENLTQTEEQVIEDFILKQQKT